MWGMAVDGEKRCAIYRSRDSCKASRADPSVRTWARTRNTGTEQPARNSGHPPQRRKPPAPKHKKTLILDPMKLLFS